MPPRIFGIVNITADSFSDGGNYLAPAAAISHARKLLADGADVLDVGAAASNPDAQTVPWAEEIKRLSPVVEAITDRTKLSIDTFSIATQRWALTQGIGWLNDIQGFPDPSLYGELAASNARLVVMHNVGARGRAERIATDPDTIFDRLFRFLVFGGSFYVSFLGVQFWGLKVSITVIFFLCFDFFSRFHVEHAVWFFFLCSVWFLCVGGVDLIGLGSGGARGRLSPRCIPIFLWFINNK